MRKPTFIAAAAALTFVAAPALALDVTASKTIPAQAGAVWTALGDFAASPIGTRPLKSACFRWTRSGKSARCR